METARPHPGPEAVSQDHPILPVRCHRRPGIPPPPGRAGGGPMTNRPKPRDASRSEARPVGVVKLADAHRLKTAADIEPLLRMVDLARVLNCSRREVERMRSAG